MPTAIFELNDSGLCCATSPDNLIVSPGYALLTDNGITTGQEALEKAYLEPRQSFSQYWRQLNLSPLPINSRVARHHADLAYAQLLQLYRDTGSPERVIFAAPGNFDREQLAILLGLANASPFEAAGLVDASVAAASQAQTRGDSLHVDIQLHQTVITRLQADQQISRTAVEILPELGIKSFYDAWAQLIADQFIRQYRFDPLHTAAGEQQLYNQLPGWLQQMETQTEIGVELDSPQGRYRINLSRTQLLDSTAARSQQFQRRLMELRKSNETLLYSHRMALLPGLVIEDAPTQVLSADSVIQGCLQNLELICGSGDLPFITRLPLSKSPQRNTTQGKSDPQAATTPSPRNTPSHVLYRHRAYAIHPGMGVAINGDTLLIDCETDVAFRFTLEDGILALVGDRSQIQCYGDVNNLITGDSLLIGNQRLDLIEVD